MKRCPHCNRVETDEALKFCRIDGTTLVNDSMPVSGEAGTAKFVSTAVANEIETSFLPHNTGAKMDRLATGPTTVLPTTPTHANTRAFAKPNRRGVVFALIGVVILVVAVGGYFYFSKKNTATIQSIAVMPFVNESGIADVEYLSDGMTETLIKSLSLLPDLAVKSRSTVFSYKGKQTTPKNIGKELNVQAVLLGRLIGGRGDQLHLTLELVDTESENVIWTDDYDRQPRELIALQNVIARDVSTKLRPNLSTAAQQKLAKNYTNDPEAYRLYLQGRYFWNKRRVEDFKRAITYFEKALTIDPNYALAYTGLADSYALLAIYDGAPAKESMPKAKDAALKALSLDNELAESHASLGQILQNYDYDFGGAEQEYKRAIELNANYASAHQWYGELLANVGRFDESADQLRRASDIDPLSLIINRMKGSTLFFARKYDASIEQLKATVELDPNFPGPHYDLFLAYHVKGAYAQSVEEFAKWRELLADRNAAVLARDSFAKGGWQGFLQAMTDNASRPVGLHPYHLAMFYIALGQNEQAMYELNVSYNERNNDMCWLKEDPRLDPLRSDPRFQELLKKVGFLQ